MPMLPNDRPLSDSEIAVAVAQAILDDRQNPGQDLPFQPHVLGLLARLGTRIQTREEQAWKQQFIEVNKTPDLEFRMAEFCWRLVGLGYLVPKIGGDWGQFQPTARGRIFLANMDPAALTPGGLDEKLKVIGFAEADPARQYARQAQHCFLAGHYEASIVMLGVANEALILALAGEIERIQPSVLPSLTSRSSRATARQDIDWLAQALANPHYRTLAASLSAAGAETDWMATLRDLLAGTSQAIRLTRNEYGHPTGFTASQEDALQLLVLFPRFADACAKSAISLASLP